MESLGGPARDCNQTVLGFSPMFSFGVMNGQARFMNFTSAAVAKAVAAMLGVECSDVYIAPVNNAEELFALLRNTEAQFMMKTPASGVDGLGWFGYFGYDTIFMIEEIERCLCRDKEVPVISLAVYRGIVQHDLQTGQCTLTANFVEGEEAFSLDELKALLETEVSHGELPVNPEYQAFPSVGREEYFRWFEKVKHHIDIGDIYQIQLGHEIRIRSKLEPFEVYMRMRKKNPSPYMYFFTTADDVTLIGASPEMFTNLDSQRNVVMRPIAGTVRNPTDEKKRKEASDRLKSDVKETAEHLMLVDLCRNDIARCCQPMSLAVDELMATEAYSHVIHLVSNVTGRLSGGLDKFDAVAATFLAGTMTGTPKLKAVEIIEKIERSPRGIYAGALGYFGFNDVMISALCIRTAIWKDGEYSIRASGGVVEESTALGEWNETISKLSSTYLAITDKELCDESFAY
ncbi:anthranilate synthase component I family protein [Ochrobactrum teleogrylli]|uniref:Anthranilate synthase component I family protein n=1 Tax=Ochrobactrum teleogrylli TaxID=2479765 RepID=A0ABY2Y6T9_9HYPH|nr:chorismate-binding protein [[Ochrobactrum] teleogrylli]TNV16135.1 anthranilate synthase component I family protein [[Ochrobactrum] teleogrylli]